MYGPPITLRTLSHASRVATVEATCKQWSISARRAERQTRARAQAAMGGPFERHSSLLLLRKQPRSALFPWHQAAIIRQRSSGSGHEESAAAKAAAPLLPTHLTAVAAVKVRAFGHSAVEFHQPIGMVMVAGEFC